jgi:2-phospho-L-lactate guanylyltransferase
MHDGTYAVIPVKPFASAKRRLSPILNCFEREQLAALMLADVLDSVCAARSLSGFVVVTCEAAAVLAAKRRGGQVVREAGESGLDQAVEAAIDALDGRAEGIAVIPADIPHLPAATIDAVTQNTADGGMTIVPAICDGGTNILSLRPVRLIPPLFGPGSYHRHTRAARAVGAVTHVHVCETVGHDLDRPRDLQTFLSFGSRTRTQDYLAGLGINDRIATLPRSDTPADFARAFA